MAVAPVADVHNYDTIYQERYVGLPTTDAAAYHDASPLNYRATACAAICSSSTAPATTTCTIRAPSS